MKRSLLTIVAFSTLLGALAPPGVARAGLDPSKPNIIVILTDDQSINTLQQMTNVQGLAASGTTFTNAFVSNPLCCPSRSTILTGLFSGHTGVWTNGDDAPPADGGYAAFTQNGNETRTLAYHLSTDLGYRTGLYGKYLNEYVAAPGAQGVPSISGWTDVHAFTSPVGYYDYELTDGILNTDGTYHAVRYGSDPSDYSTNVVADLAVTFLQEQTDDQPFFLYFTPYGPHGPTTPGPGDEGVTASTSFSTPAFNEADVSDKPLYIQQRPLLKRAALKKQYDRQYATLASIDRAVGRFEAALSPEELANTMFIFASDNGLSYGDQRWTGKQVPYERSIHVPLIVKMPGQVASATVDRLVANVDLAPTIFDLVGITPDDPVYGSHLDGRSLLPLLTGSGTFSPRSAILLEHMYDGRNTTPSYCGVRMATWMYAAYSDGFEELYNLSKDPYELRNQASSNTAMVAKMRARTQALCDPMPPDFPAGFWGSL
ncbi:MAG: hypothetical protein QOE83_1096 [Actinomycetota bacterium]|nr:hypothetical protein [Actinomycetota bacterium]